MRTLTIMLFTVAVAAGCGKKDNEAKTEAKPTEPAKPAADPAKPADPAAAPTAPTPAASADLGKPEELKPTPAEAPQACKDAEAAMKKLMACDKVDANTKATMAKSWNLAVEGSYKQYAAASADQKKTIEGSCAKMPDTIKLLTADCP